MEMQVPEAVFSFGVKALRNTIKNLSIKTISTTVPDLKKRSITPFLLQYLILLEIKLFSMKSMTIKSMQL